MGMEWLGFTMRSRSPLARSSILNTVYEHLSSKFVNDSSSKSIDTLLIFTLLKREHNLNNFLFFICPTKCLILVLFAKFRPSFCLRIAKMISYNLLFWFSSRNIFTKNVTKINKKIRKRQEGKKHGLVVHKFWLFQSFLVKCRESNY